MGKKERKRKSNEQKEVKNVSYNLTFLKFFIACYMFRLLGEPIRQLEIYMKKGNLSTTH